MNDKHLAAIAVVLMAVISLLAAANYGLIQLPTAPSAGGQTESGQPDVFDGIMLSDKPNLVGTIVENPDFAIDNTNDIGWLRYPDGSVDPEVLSYGWGPLEMPTRWRGNGFVDNATYFGRNTVAIIHPISTDESSYVEQAVNLPLGGSYYLVFGLANIGKYLGNPGCADNIFKVSVTDDAADASKILFYGVQSTQDAWKHYMVRISQYAGKNVTVRVDAIAGGPCNLWSGEWGAVDYVDIIPSAI